MISYLLLRSNKQTGPYSLEELIRIGLKPYDLVWADGKSAAWRYPGELEELKPYAPMVEEQPFDRFFKKTTEKITETFPVKKPELQTIRQDTSFSESINPYQPRVVVEDKKPFTPRKSVFVTLPPQTAMQSKQVIAAEPEPLLTQTVTIRENPVNAQVKYEQPLEEIKEMYVKTLQERKNRLARKGFVRTYLKRAAVVAGLVGIGVLAGFIIKPKKDKDLLSVSQTLPAVIAGRGQMPMDSTPVTVATAGTEKPQEENGFIEPVSPKRQDNDDPVTEAALPAERAVVPENRDKKQPKQYNPAPDRQVKEELYNFSASSTDPVSGERTRTVRTKGATTTEASTKSPASSSATGLEDQVFVTSNDYKKVAFGGIRDLRLTVINNSRYALENVIVELQYLKPSEQPLRTENIQFRSIASNESSTIRIPDTNRGIKVSFRILSIGSKQDL